MATNPRYEKPPRREPMTFEDFKKLEQKYSNVKYEYIDGVAYLMAGGTIEHNRIARNTASAIERHFGDDSCQVYVSDVQVLIGMKENGKKNYIYPDVVVSCDGADRRRGNTLIRSPRLVVEVLSPSTEFDDRGVKLKAYKAYPTIYEYVLINQFAKHVEIYTKNVEDITMWDYRVYNEDEPTIELASLDVQITMDEIYRGVNFAELIEEE